MTEKKVYPYGVVTITRVQTSSEVDYVKDEKLYKGSRGASVLVTAQSDLANLSGYAPGTVAYTAGFGSMWQLDADDNWVEI